MSDKEDLFSETSMGDLEISTDVPRRRPPRGRISAAVSRADSESSGPQQLQTLLTSLPDNTREISLENLGRRTFDMQTEMFRLMAENSDLNRDLLMSTNASSEVLEDINSKTDNINTSLSSVLPGIRRDQREQRMVVEDTHQLVQQSDSDIRTLLIFMREFKTSFASMERRITSIETGVTGVGQALVDVGTEVRGTREDVREVGTEVKGTRAEMRESFDDVKKVLNKNFSLIIGKLDSLNGKLSQKCELKYHSVGAFVNSFVWCILVLLWFVSQFIQTVCNAYLFIKEQIIDTISRFFPFVKDNVELLLRIVWRLFEISYIILVIDKVCLFLNFPKLGLFLVAQVFRFFMQAIIQCISIFLTILWSFTEPVRDLLYELYKESGLESIFTWLLNYMMDLFSKAGSWFAEIVYEKIKSNLTIPKFWGGTIPLAKSTGEKLQAKMYMDELVALTIEYRKNPSKMSFVLKQYDATLSKIEDQCINIVGTMSQYFYNIMNKKTSRQQTINKQFNAHINKTPNITLQLKQFLDGFQDVTKDNLKKLNSHFTPFLI